MSILKWVFAPFAVIYKFATDFRNHLYNINYSKSFEFEANVISVGNLSVGGTGKTPMVEYLIRLLKAQYHVATLSRGYKRRSKGFIEANSKHTEKEIGDESLQFYLKYGQDISVNVIEERAWGIPNILMNHPNNDIVVLDDAYQHRSVIPSLNILLTSYDHLFFQDYVLPLGRLRESRKDANRSDVINVTNCKEDLPEKERSDLKSTISKYSDSPIFFSKVNYLKPVAFTGTGQLERNEPVLLVSGVANSSHFKKYVTQNWRVKKHYDFLDHKNYNEKIVKTIASCSRKEGAAILTTEKDYVKLRNFNSEWRDLRIFYLPIEVEFLDNKETFDQLILGSINQYNRTEQFNAE